MLPTTSPLRALITDVDGTLTDADRHLNPAAMHLLGEFEARGIPVILATGNVLPIALALHRSMGLTGPIVAENGGLIYRKLGGRETVERLADRSVAWRAYQKLRRSGLPLRPLFTDRWRETEVALEPSGEVRTIRQLLRGSPVRVEETGYAIHLMERGAGKLPALRKALGPLGLSMSDCLVAGDGDNDVEMLRSAGFAVSFASGSPRARRAADYVSRRSYAKGFVEALMGRRVVSRMPRAERSDHARR